MIVRVLGSAAGGGVPQWNCACAHCSAARAGTRPRRSQSSFAVSGDGARWWLVNASPDVAAHVEAFAPLQPGHGRGTPIAGMLFTDANVDHLGGLAVLRQTGDHAFALHSSAVVRTIACEQPAFAAFAQPPHRWSAVASGDRFDLDDRLRVRVIAVEGRTPGYAGRTVAPDAVVAYAIEDRTSGAEALFAPVFASVGAELLAAAATAALGFYDGSFWSDDELSGVGVVKDARSLGHAPVGGDDGSLRALAGLARSGRSFFAHLNNTTPLLDPGSSAYAQAREAGFDVALDGQEFEV